ncbi:MAG TPA: flagellar hook-length control protein FliK [Candidatus Baltobacteraceae bacterium]
MAFPLLAIGEAVGQALIGHKGTSHAKGLLADLNFGSQLQQKLDRLGTDGSDLISQLAGLLQSGTPLATIIDRVSKAVAAALAKATGNDGDVTRRRTLQRALAAALAPPGTSPPGQSPTQQGAALEKRLTDLLSKISRELEPAGQQKRFSGAVLDANSAREIPAQQKKTESTGTQPAAPVSLAELILRNVVQQLQQHAPQTAQTPQPPAQTAPQQITAQSADVLGRMLARAATADAQRPDAPASAVTPSSAHATTPTSTSASPSDLFARLMHVIAQASGENASHSDGKQQQDQSQNTANTTPAGAFTNAIANASSPGAQPATAAPAPYTVDPQAVIEQLVKGIVLRNSGSTSEVRMRLQPENLGDVSLKLTVTGNTISANIVAQNADVRQALLQNQQQLARSLAEAGLSLGKFSVDVSGGNPGFSQQQSPPHRSFARTGFVHLGPLAEDDLWTDQRFGPALLTGSKPLVLNYLA